MTYKLMIKTHNKTGMKYLCITSRENWKKYTGSGVRWKRHLKEHGVDLTTKLIYETDDYEDFVEQCEIASCSLNVVLSEEFANAIPELGYDNADASKPNVVVWWENADEKAKLDVIRRRQASLCKFYEGLDQDIIDATTDKIRETWRSKSPEEIEAWRDKSSQRLKQYYSLLSYDEKRELIQPALDGAKVFFANKDSEKFKSWKYKVVASIRDRIENEDPSIRSERIRNARLSTPPEIAERRKKKIQEKYATGEHQHLFDKMSEERQGVYNPNAIVITWKGEEYTKREFKLFLRKEGLTYNTAEAILEDDAIHDCYYKRRAGMKTYKELVCPHCNKFTTKKPSSFMRWHFDNCKEKV